MPRKSQKLLIEVREGEISDRYREFFLNVKVERNAIELSDLVSREGGGKSLERILEKSVKEGVTEYIESGKEFFKRAIAANENEEAEGVNA